VTYAQKNGMSLVCVVMQENTPDHYTDTRTMFDYCFDNFKLLYAADYEKDEAEDQDIQPFASVDENATIVVPANVSFSDLTREIVYDSSDENVLGTIQYSYGDHVVGTADVLMNEVSDSSYVFANSIYDGDSEVQDESEEAEESVEDTKDNTRSIHIELTRRNITVAVGLLVALVVLLFLIYWLLTHTYLLRQKVAGMRSRRVERTRYRTIRDTRKSRRKKREKKSKGLRF
jgi:hypothetical protein